MGVFNLIQETLYLALHVALSNVSLLGRHGSPAERLLGSWVRIPPGATMFVCCTVFVLSGRGLCDGPIPRPEESYRLWCVSDCDQVKINNLDTYCE
jgi:hypothetical protein